MLHTCTCLTWSWPLAIFSRQCSSRACRRATCVSCCCSSARRSFATSAGTCMRMQNSFYLWLSVNSLAEGNLEIPLLDLKLDYSNNTPREPAANKETKKYYMYSNILVAYTNGSLVRTIQSRGCLIILQIIYSSCRSRKYRNRVPFLQEIQ